MTTHKAWVGAVAAFLASLAATLQGRTDLDTMRAVDWVVVLIASAATGFAVWAVPNHRRGVHSPPQ